MSTTPQPLPNPFLHSQAVPLSGKPSRFAMQPALAAFLICLVLGLATVAWRAKMYRDDAHARAALEALARGSAVEVQFVAASKLRRAQESTLAARPYSELVD